MSCCSQKKDQEAKPVETEASPTESREELILSLDGIHCINCVGKVERIFQAREGVLEARVNLTKKQARLKVEGETFVLTDALTELESAGFQGRLLNEQQTAQQERDDAEQKSLLLKMGVSGCVAANVMLISFALYAGQFQGIDQGLKHFFQVVSFALATPVVFYGGRHFAEPAVKALASKSVTIDVPITIGLAATYILSVVSFFRGTEHQYFDTVTAFVFALLVGRYLQSVGMSRVRSSLDLLLGLRPESATLLIDGVATETPVDKLQVGQVALLKQGSGVPADGTLISGQLEADESSMTGESLPVPKMPGDSLLAGTTVFSGFGQIRIDAVGSKTTLSRLAELIEKSQENRIGEGRLSGKIAAYFSAAILVLSTLVFLYWLPAGVEEAVLTSVSVLVITCPCALGLALPLAYWMAVRTGADRGVLVKDEAALEMTPVLTDLILDKTGTVTIGRPQLTQERFADGQSAESVGHLVELIERDSPHPFARALAQKFSEFARPTCDSPVVQTIPGRGRQMNYQGHQYFLGNRVSDSGLDIELTQDGEMLAGWSFNDSIRPEAQAAIAALKDRGLKLHLLSGDNPDRTEAVAKELGLESFAGSQLPQDKAERVEHLQSSGAVVGLLGDGVNDGPALASADVGAAMGHAAAVATASSPVLLLRPGLTPVLSWLNLGKAYRRTVRTSLGLSFVYNLIAVPFAAAGYVSPLVAAIAMPVASLAVVINSLALTRRMP